MKKRIITSFVGLPVLFGCLYLRGWIAELVLAFLTLVGVIECYRAIRTAKYNPFPWGGYAGPVLMLLMAWLIDIRNPLLLIATCMGITIVGCIFSKQPNFPDTAVSIYPLFTCLMPLSMIMMMLNSTFGRVPGVALITMSFAIAFGGDASAYFGGRAFGKHKLCPTVSPKKTVEGAVCYFIGSTFVAVMTRLFFVKVVGYAMPGIPAAIVLGLVGGFFAQIGDLTASLLKRYSGIKDYGKIFPGHGGVMDRLDSVMFTVIVLYCYTLVLK
ncbi:MAG: phosphatidate cytidylyltransferase [Clostridia bacterium]|nr:phosphatidate cytidylyltransferase [Clostridia bacterium]